MRPFRPEAPRNNKETEKLSKNKQKAKDAMRPTKK